MVLVLLTLEKHQDGIWVTRLVESLGRCGWNGCEDDRRKIEIIPIERFFHGSPPTQNIFQNVTGIINRVSDAAEPVAFKTTVAILMAAQQRGIPVFNGPQAYSLCANKFCHHVIFESARVQSPPSRVVANASVRDIAECIVESADSSCHSATSGRNDLLQYPILTKPNAGGFGSGIHYINDDKALQRLTDDKLATCDGIRLVQNYIQPADDCIYRVWFLVDCCCKGDKKKKKKVQCSVQRRVGSETAANDLTAGCVGGVCQRPQSNASTTATPSWLQACVVSDEIQQDVQRIVSQIPDAHAGSIEYLWSSDGVPLYFDLNLLSTLPLPETVQQADEVWGRDYDPWMELARSILCVLDADNKCTE